MVGADLGGSIAVLSALQTTVGNRATAQLLNEHAGNGAAAHVSLHGRTWPEYDGGAGTIRNRRVRRARDCDCSDDEPCTRVSGTLRIKYKARVTIEMPPVPDDLTPCQERRVRAFLRDVLGPHEREHARRLRTYNGTTNRPFSATECGRDAALDAAREQTQQMHDDEAGRRASDADARSLAIDPFDRPIDLDC